MAKTISQIISEAEASAFSDFNRRRAAGDGVFGAVDVSLPGGGELNVFVQSRAANTRGAARGRHFTTTFRVKLPGSSTFVKVTRADLGKTIEKGSIVRSATNVKSAVRIDKMVDAWEPVMRRAFLESIGNVRSSAQVGAIARMLEGGDVEGAVRAVGLDPIKFRPLDRAVRDVFEHGGTATSASLPRVARDGLRVEFQFDVRNPVAERWLNNHSSRMVTEIVDDQREMIRSFLRIGLEAGDNPRTSALDLVGRVAADGRRSGGVIGLTSSQSEWVRNYEAELASDNPVAALERSLRDRRFDGSVRRAAASGEPIPAELREKMVTAYENRALRYRAEGIARTETMASLHEAQSQAMDQAVATGNLKRENVAYIWRATHDDRTRDSHAEMDGQEVAMGEMFVTGDGAQLEFPGDPNGPPEETINCRCWREPKVDFLAGIA